MKQKFAVVWLSALLILSDFVFTNSTYASNSNSIAPEFTVQTRRKKKIRRFGFVIHRNSGRVRRAICRDGKITLSRHRRGTCSRHRGVRRWL